MSSGFSDKMERDYLDEQFMREAAKLMDAELLEELKEAREMDVDGDWLKQLEMSSVKQIQKKRRTQKIAWRLRKIGRIAAAIVIAICVAFSTIYVSVDAAREAINNFFTGKTNRRATVVYPENVEGEIYSIIPENWRGPLYATWLPDGYMQANSGTHADRYWWLCYSHKDNILDTICIYAWDETYTPSIDIEEYEIVSEGMVQGVPATVYLDAKRDYHTLIMVKNNLTVQISGTISKEDIIQIAESLEF